MRFVTGAAVGFALGWAAASWLRGQETEVEVRREALGMAGSMARHPSAQAFRQRVVDLTGERGLEAIRRARASIQRRLEANADDVSLN
ncbi:MAG TPA: hypothetical protein VFT27_08995 [Actinomycetota bacterium]|nr:hypothetical protein [Actinomycetota bacterium]